MGVLLFCLGVFGLLPVIGLSVFYGALPVLMVTLLIVGWLDPEGRAGFVESATSESAVEHVESLKRTA